MLTKRPNAAGGFDYVVESEPMPEMQPQPQVPFPEAAAVLLTRNGVTEVIKHPDEA
jgi:hypothetical protein